MSEQTVETRAWRVDQVAAYCDLDRNTVYKLVRLGQIPHARAGRAVRFDPEAIEAWLRGEWKPEAAQREQATA